jgi:hypothetical protein
MSGLGRIETLEEARQTNGLKRCFALQAALRQLPYDELVGCRVTRSGRLVPRAVKRLCLLGVNLCRIAQFAS